MCLKNWFFVGVLLFMWLPAAASANDERCSALAEKGAMNGLCTAYVSGRSCLEVENHPTRRCEVLRENFARASGGLDIDAFLMNAGGEARKTIWPDGGSVNLPGVATVAFPAGAFPTPTDVALRVTSDPRVDELFSETAFIFRATTRSEHELRISTGGAPPLSESVVVTMEVPESLVKEMPAGHSIEAFAAIEQGGMLVTPHPVFEVLVSHYDEEARLITFEVPGAAFGNNQYTEGEYQAIIVLAPTPGEPHPAISAASLQYRHGDIHLKTGREIAQRNQEPNEPLQLTAPPWLSWHVRHSKDRNQKVI